MLSATVMSASRAVALRSSLASSLLALACAAGCSAERGTDAPTSSELVGAPEDDGVGGRDAESVVGAVTVGQTLKTNANLNLRASPSKSAKILLVIPKGSVVTVLTAAASGGFYHVRFAGTAGWVYGLYLDKTAPTVAPPPASDAGTGTDAGPTTPPPTDAGPMTPPASGPIDVMVSRAKAGVGFSYYWGHGRWSMGGVSSSAPAGSCSGSCPSCTHSGSYGADCSGYVAKIWQIPSSNSDVTVDSHPYSTADFVSDTKLWSTVSRDAVKKGDAFVYNSGGAGHIVLFESGDPWGSSWVYEAKGCSYGVQHNLRTVTSAYHAIRKN